MRKQEEIMKTQIISLQLALFFKDIVNRPDVEFKDINENMFNIFDAVPSILPLPKELPTDVPMITQRSENNQYVCNIARSRIDLIFQRIDGEKSNAEILKDFNSKVNGFAKYIDKKQDLVRFGLVARYFHEDEKAIETIKNKYFSNLPESLRELSFRYNRNSEHLKYKINDIVEINTATIKIGGKEQSGILINRDINNIPENGKLFTHKELLGMSEKYAERLSEKDVEELLR